MTAGSRTPVSSPLLTTLFPEGVAAAEMSEPATRDALLNGEDRSITNATEQRIGEFAAGRLCARFALEKLGIPLMSLLVGIGRQPRWPRGTIGSITHTAGFYGAVAGLQSNFQALGVDVELVSHVVPDVHSAICHPTEFEVVVKYPSKQRQELVALIFSAKEAFYKCQYPITENHLEFHDVALDIEFDHANSGRFYAYVLKRSHPWHSEKLTGNFRVFGDRVMTGIAIPAISRPSINMSAKSQLPAEILNKAVTDA